MIIREVYRFSSETKYVVCCDCGDETRECFSIDKPVEGTREGDYIDTDNGYCATCMMNQIADRTAAETNGAPSVAASVGAGTGSRQGYDSIL
jgi:hypothetical protein